MSDFNTISTTKKPLDPRKRVKYSMGLVLGVDEFEQEQFYLMERDRLHQRALHGYGTVKGLKVSIQEDTNSPTVMVSPGLAVNPKGETICVPENQCAVINEWLTEHQQEVLEYLGSPPQGGPLSLYVVLCYRECETDTVPIPGEPCRSQDDTMAPSRIADHFELSLELEPPLQVEENAVRCFGDFLRMIEITTDGSKTFKDLVQMEEFVRELFTGSSPGCSLPVMGSPPNDDKLYLDPDDAPGILQAIFRIWVTELRPKLLQEGKICPDQPEESCVLLAQLDVDVDISDDILYVDPASPGIIIIEDNRPILLHTRLLQEWLLCGQYSSITVNGGGGGVIDHGSLIGMGTDAQKTPIPSPEKIVLPMVTISHIKENQFELWFNIDTHKNDALIQSLPKSNIKVLEERDDEEGFLKELKTSIKKGKRNAWNVTTSDTETGFLRFTFNISKIKLTTGKTLEQYASSSGIDFIGQSCLTGEKIVTVFFRVKI